MTTHRHVLSYPMQVATLPLDLVTPGRIPCASLLADLGQVVLLCGLLTLQLPLQADDVLLVLEHRKRLQPNEVTTTGMAVHVWISPTLAARLFVDTFWLSTSFRWRSSCRITCCSLRFSSPSAATLTSSRPFSCSHTNPEAERKRQA